MIDKTTRKELATMATNISAARKALNKYEAQYAKLRLKALRSVTMTKDGDTITLELGKRVIKAKKPARYNDRYNLQENGKRIATEYFGGIHDIRFAIAMGQL